MIDIRQDNPLAPELAFLMQRHTAAMEADTPPESRHMLPASALADPAISFFTLREGDAILGMGAIKRLPAPGSAAPTHGEIKSMHVVTEARGRGLSRQMLAHLIAHARSIGLTRLSLETGAQPSFAAARALYERAGFSYCAPFGSYREDPLSVFLTRDISG